MIYNSKKVEKEKFQIEVEVADLRSELISTTALSQSSDASFERNTIQNKTAQDVYSYSNWIERSDDSRLRRIDLTLTVFQILDQLDSEYAITSTVGLVITRDLYQIFEFNENGDLEITKHLATYNPA